MTKREEQIFNLSGLLDHSLWVTQLITRNQGDNAQKEAENEKSDKRKKFLEETASRHYKRVEEIKEVSEKLRNLTTAEKGEIMDIINRAS